LIEHSFKAFSLDDLVKSFDNTINSCFSDQEIIESNEESTKTTSKFVFSPLSNQSIPIS